MADRIAKWFLFTVLFAFIPIIIAALIAFTSDAPAGIRAFNAELLFSVVMLSVASLRDVATKSRGLLQRYL